MEIVILAGILTTAIIMTAKNGEREEALVPVKAPRGEDRPQARR